jgi:hypothetical protein
LSRANALFDRVNKTVRALARVDVSPYVFSSIVAGTERYDLPPDVVKVWVCRYGKVSDASQATTMAAVTIDQLENEAPDYRKTKGEPRAYYVLAGQIGLVPVPDTSSSGGVPFLAMEVSRAPTMADADSLPAHVNSADAWVYGVASLYALEQGDPRAAHLDEAYHRALNSLKAFVGQRSAKAKDKRFVPAAKAWRVV